MRPRCQLHSTGCLVIGSLVAYAMLHSLMTSQAVGHAQRMAERMFERQKGLVLLSRGIQPRSYQKASLKKYRMPELSAELNESFLKVVVKQREAISNGASELRKLIRTESH